VGLTEGEDLPKGRHGRASGRLDPGDGDPEPTEEDEQNDQFALRTQVVGEPVADSSCDQGGCHDADRPQQQVEARSEEEHENQAQGQQQERDTTGDGTMRVLLGPAELIEQESHGITRRGRAP
jgi:hypothetical protein